MYAKDIVNNYNKFVTDDLYVATKYNPSPTEIDTYNRLKYLLTEYPNCSSLRVGRICNRLQGGVLQKHTVKTKIRTSEHTYLLYNNGYDLYCVPVYLDEENNFHPKTTY